MCTVREVLSWLEGIAPPELAEDYDNVGLMVGTGSAKVHGILCALDLSEKVLQEAREKKANLIITHHPLLFAPLRSIDQESRRGKIIYELIRSDISLIACHTNLDNAPGGLNDYLAGLLGLEGVTTLQPKGEAYLLSCYLPEDHRERVEAAMFAAGGGKVGAYEQCGFFVQGVGGYRPAKGASPFAGRVGELQSVPEAKLEMMVEAAVVKQVVDALKQAHPYQEPVFQVQKSGRNSQAGSGRMGALTPPLRLEELCERLKGLLGAPHLRVAGDGETNVQTVALCTGAGDDLYETARAKGADVLITGEVKHHVFVEAGGQKTAIVEAGHYFTEAIVRELLVSRLQSKINEVKYNNVNVWGAQRETAPFDYI